jgi:diguanylate cyclase (GGDEF)-like protein/PAS domain S-box-containing protein
MVRKPKANYVVIGIKLLAAIALTELLILLLSRWLSVDRWLSPLEFDLADTLILSVTASFLIYFWVVKPLKVASKTIDEYKLLEDQLRSSENQYRNLFKNNPLPMVIYDREMRSILAVNDIAVDHYGYSRAEFLAMDLKDLYFPEQHADLVASVSQVHDEIRRPGVWKHKKKNGTLMYVDVVTHDLSFNGRDARLALFTDITEQKKAAEDLQAGENRYRSLFDNMLDGFAYCKMIFEQDRPQDFVYLEVNDAFETLTGLKDVVGRKVSEVIPGIRESHPELLEIYGRVAMTGKPERFEVSSGSFGGWLSVAAYSTEKGYFVAVFDNITERKKAEEKIRNTAKFPEENPSPVMRFSRDGTIIYANAASMPLQKHWKSEIGGKVPADIMSSVADVCGTDGTKEFQVACGQSLYSLIMVCVKGADYINVYGRDITDQARATEEMRKLSLAVEESSDWILITDRSGNITYANKAVERISGYTKKELIGKNPRVLKSGANQKDLYKELWDTILSGRSFSAIIKNRKKTGEIFEIYHTITPLKDDTGAITHFVATSKDLTQQKALEERLDYLAYFDALTGLPNRKLFLNRLEQDISRVDHSKKRVAVLSIDIDRFKLINETLGPEVGDKVLIEIGKVLSGSVREGDTVARFGNDEFEIALVDVADADDVIFVADRIMKDLSQPMKMMDNEIVTTITMGIAIFPEDGTTANDLLKNATAALCKAQEQGRKNYSFYTAAIDNKASEMFLMERHLFNALKNREFVLYYQPYVDTDTKKMAGMEALIRWKSPDQGLVPPGRFIPVLEDTGLIIDVGEWILEEAFGQIKAWEQKGLPVVPVSVNLSLIQFRQKNLLETVNRMLREFSIKPELITFEITESAFMQNIAFTISVLDEFKKMGFSLSIDDFGTGYSSLSYLKRFAVDNLKIDISFVRDITTDPDTASIITAIIAMAHSLKIKTIAEGVETEEQWKFLRLLRCDTIQGYYFHKPMPAEEVEKLLRTVNNGASAAA